MSVDGSLKVVDQQTIEKDYKPARKPRFK